MPVNSKRAPRSSAKTTRGSDASIATAVDAFRRILRELRVVARKTELATGLSAAQLFVLSTVARVPGSSVNDIAAATMTDRSSAAAIVDRLVEQGYVTREQSGSDRRRASIELTARGRRAAGKSAPAPTTLLIAALEKLPAGQLDGLAAGLTALTQSMEIADKPAGMLFEETRAERSTVRRRGG
jgi:DNA-binding MarR family transcriptional regulator